MQYSYVLASAGLIASAVATGEGYGYESMVAPAPVYYTQVVTAHTTYCPEATQVTMGQKTYTVSSATTLTITDCPCTLTHSSSVPGAAPVTSTPAAAGAQSTGVVSQISDNQPQAPTYAPAAPQPTTTAAAAGSSAASPAAGSPSAVAPAAGSPSAVAPAAGSPSAVAPAAGSPTASFVTQISDNQPQAPTQAPAYTANSPAAVTQMSAGAPAPAAGTPAVSPAGTPAAAATPAQYTAGASRFAVSGGSLAAIFGAVAYFL